MPGDPPPALAGFEEPSLVFALGADVTLTDGAGAAKQGADRAGWRWSMIISAPPSSPIWPNFSPTRCR